MSLQRDIKQLEAARRRSRKALPVYTVISVLGVVFIWYARLSAWQAGIVLFLTAGFLLGDIWNIIYCGRKLQRLRREKETAER